MNTFFEHPPDATVTYWAIGSKPFDDISFRAFAQLDFCIVEQDWLDCIQDVYSDRLAVLSSHHFLVISRVCIDIPKTEPRERAAVPDFKACHHVDTALTFASEVHHWMQQLDANDWIDHRDISSFNNSLNEAFPMHLLQLCQHANIKHVVHGLHSIHWI